MFSLSQENTTTSTHLTFKGVPIDGTLNDFVSRLEKTGFTKMGLEDGVLVLKGDFASFQDCLIGVATLKNKDLVYRIGVVFPDADTWSSLSSYYEKLKELLTVKYGKPTQLVEDFQGDIKPETDPDKFLEVKMDKCIYQTTYELPNGSIILSIEHISFSRCFVMLRYIDKINSASIRSIAIDDL
jgi:hypothetical protein